MDLLAGNQIEEKHKRHYIPNLQRHSQAFTSLYNIFVTS